MQISWLKKGLVVAMFMTALVPGFMAEKAHAVMVDVDGVNNYLSNPVQVFLNAGTYKVTAKSGTYDAWSAWDGVSSGNTDTCAVSTGCLQTDGFRGWLNSYILLSADITNVILSGPGLVLPGQGFATNLGVVYPNASDALTHAVMATFTLTQGGLVGFANGESAASALNNRGGMSLHVKPVPEPTTMLLFGSGLAGILAWRMKKREV